MKSYKEFAEEAEYLEENPGRTVRNLRRKNKNKGDIPSGAGRKGKKGKDKGGGGSVLPTVGGAAVGGAAANAVGGALRGIGNLVGNLAKGALGVADRASKRHSQADDASAGKPGKPLDKIT